MIAEALGLNADRFGEDTHVVVQGLGNDVEMPSCALLAFANLHTKLVETPVDVLETLVDVFEPAIDLLEPPIDPLEPAIDGAKARIHSSEPRVHRFLQVRDGHRLSCATHRSIVVLRSPCQGGHDVSPLCV